MRKIVCIFLTGIIQAFGQDKGPVIAEPTTASFNNYINAPISPASGVPNINIPFYQLESSHKAFTVGINLSYHVYNVHPDIPEGEVGAGWTLFKSGIISRGDSGEKVDEIEDWMQLGEKEADTFYYTFPGHSGKFKIYKNPESNDLFLNNITAEKLKIEYERDLSSPKLIINSFSITDDSGFKYIFTDYNTALAKYKAPIYQINYKSAFVLNKVLAPDGREIVTYQYEKKTKYTSSSSTLKEYEYNKLNTISTDKGKIKFEYENFGDYKVNKITLADNAGRTLSDYRFSYDNIPLPSYPATVNKSVLSSVNKYNKAGIFEAFTRFEYNTNYEQGIYGDYLCPSLTKPFKNPDNYYTLGLLHKIIYPTRGYTTYNFKANRVYEDKSTKDYTTTNVMVDPENQYYEKNEIAFNTNTSRTYSFQVTPPGTNIYLTPGVEEDYEEGGIHPYPFTYRIKKADGTFAEKTAVCGEGNLIDIYNLTPGQYNITIPLWGGNGTFRIYSLQSKPKPYKNESPLAYGARIQSIESYDADHTLSLSKKYEYPLIATSSTEEIFQNTNCDDSSFSNRHILYKNVKEMQYAGSENNGYVQYYYKTPRDYVQTSDPNYIPYFTFTSDGILDKKEIYNKQNLLVASSLYEYNFQEVSGAKKYEIDCSSNYTKAAWVQYTKEIQTSYLGSGSFYVTTETTNSPYNFRTSYTKTITKDGHILEATTKYANELGNTRFTNKNMISIPLEAETKTDGVMVSRVTTQYDDTVHLYPTSLVKTNLNEVAETEITFDLYDDKGNLVQTTDKAGNSVTTIWGYYKTLPIAQIVGAKYSDVSSMSVVTSAIAASNADADNPANEASLLTALENLRLHIQFQKYSMAVYTYDPLVGITNSISSKGIKLTYEYDDSGRLIRTKNATGQVIKENEYNYKH